jgi:hypothetical protein
VERWWWWWWWWWWCPYFQRCLPWRFTCAIDRKSGPMFAREARPAQTLKMSRPSCVCVCVCVLLQSRLCFLLCRHLNRIVLIKLYYICEGSCKLCTISALCWGMETSVKKGDWWW